MKGCLRVCKYIDVCSICCFEPGSFRGFQTNDYSSSWQREGEAEGEESNLKTSVYQIPGESVRKTN